MSKSPVEDIASAITKEATEIEFAVLSGLMLDRPTATAAMRFLKQGYFFTRRGQAIFGAIKRLIENNRWQADMSDLLNPLLLVDEIKKLEAPFNEEADLARLSEYIGGVTRFFSAPKFYSWVELLLKNWSKRRLLRVAEYLQQESAATDRELDELIDGAISEIGKLKQLGLRADTTTLDALTDELLVSQEERIEAIPTSWEGLNDLLAYGGFARGDLVIVAGRPGKGKTTMGLEFVGGWAVDGYKQLVVGLEMRPKESVRKLTYMRAAVSFESINKQLFTNDELRRWRYECQVIARPTVHFTNEPRHTIATIYKEALAVRQQMGGLDIIVVDYLGLIKPVKSTGSKAEDLGEISRELKLMAVELDCVVLALHQINREGDKRGKMGSRIEEDNLKGSGDIEQDADTILIIQPEGRPVGDGVEVDITLNKQRKGPKGYVPTIFSTTYGRFEPTGQSVRGTIFNRRAEVGAVIDGDNW